MERLLDGTRRRSDRIRHRGPVQDASSERAEQLFGMFKILSHREPPATPSAVMHDKRDRMGHHGLKRVDALFTRLRLAVSCRPCSRVRRCHRPDFRLPFLHRTPGVGRLPSILIPERFVDKRDRGAFNAMAVIVRNGDSDARVGNALQFSLDRLASMLKQVAGAVLAECLETGRPATLRTYVRCSGRLGV